MTENFKYTLSLFAASARGIKVCKTENADIESVRNIAVSQGIWTLVYTELVKHYPDAKKYEGEFFGTYSTGIARKSFTLDILKKASEKGLTFSLIKGPAVSRLYKDPDLRPSGDIDIFTEEKFADDWCDFLTANGYSIIKKEKTDHHIVTKHKNGGMLEVHTKLYSIPDRELLFGGNEPVNEPQTDIVINGNTYKTLGVNDGLLYYTAHYIKHFIKGGGGIRQMMDLLLYIDAYKNDIDFETYNKYLKELRYYKLIEAVKSVGDKYFGFDFKAKENDLTDMLLDDNEIGGLFGHTRDTKTDFAEQLYKRRSSMGSIKYKTFMATKAERTFLRKLFPTQQEYITKYKIPFARHKILLPIAFIKRILDVIVRRTTAKKPNTYEINTRMELMKNFDIID